MSAKLFVISSPSGGGKTTVVQHLCTRLPQLKRSVSVTTRPPRLGERDGVDYTFVADKAFERMRSEGQLLEWAQVHGHSYGTPRAFIEEALAQGQSVVSCIDVQGARAVRQHLKDRTVLIFLMPPSLEALKERLQGRSTETRDALQTRLAAAREELDCAAWYDFRVVNADLEEAVNQIESIIKQATQNRLESLRNEKKRS
jgi:guanylate kinase